MSRRRKSSPAEDLMDLVAMLPWWAGITLAIVLYLILHYIASQHVVTSAQPGQIGAMMSQTIWKAAANIGQYALPLICLAGAAVSAWRRRYRQNLVADVAQSTAADALDGMSWREFEMLVGESFRLQGYHVVETGGSADGGVDLMLTKGGEKFLVQCKQWRAFKVGVDVVRELYGVMAARGATGGFVVTSGRFTDDAASFASGRNINLIDGPKLHGLLRQAQSSKGRALGGAVIVSPVTTAISPPTCPLCSKVMVKRTAKRGANAGGEFWGCTGYPACRGTRQIG